MKEYRLARVASEINRSYQILSETLMRKGFEVVSKPTSKITEEMYQVLLYEFSTDKSHLEKLNKFKSIQYDTQTQQNTNSKTHDHLKVETYNSESINKEQKSDKIELPGPKILGKINSKNKLNLIKFKRGTVLGYPNALKLRKLVIPSPKLRNQVLDTIKKEIKQRNLKDEEFEALLAEIKHKGFTMSEQVSDYIVKNKLGTKYKHISGILEMENNHSSWEFNGGFPPKIYAKLCKRLKLGNKGTNSKVVKFTPFKDID